MKFPFLKSAPAPVVYQAGRVGGLPMTRQPIANAIQDSPDHPAVAAIIQILEAKAAEAKALAQNEDVYAEASHLVSYYNGAAGNIADVLDDIGSMARGEEKPAKMKPTNAVS